MTTTSSHVAVTSNSLPPREKGTPRREGNQSPRRPHVKLHGRGQREKIRTVGPKVAMASGNKWQQQVETDTAGHNPDLENAAIQGDGASAPQLRGFRDCVQGYVI